MCPSKPFKSALDGALKGTEMPPFQGYIGRAPDPQQVIYQLREELRSLRKQLDHASERIADLKNRIRYLGSE